MDANRMILECRLSSDGLDSSIIPDISDENWLYYLNVAQEEFVKTRYSGNNLFKTGFNGSEKRNDDLNNITKSLYFATTAVDINTYFLNFTLPFSDANLSTPSTDKYMFYVRGNGFVTKPSCGSQYVDIKVEEQDEIDVVLRNPFKRPILNRIVGYFENGGMFMLTDGTYTIGRAKIACLTFPIAISNNSAYAPVSDCLLAPHTHREIIAKAVELATGDLKPEKLQIKLQQDTQTE